MKSRFDLIKEARENFPKKVTNWSRLWKDEQELTQDEAKEHSAQEEMQGSQSG